MPTQTDPMARVRAKVSLHSGPGRPAKTSRREARLRTHLREGLLLDVAERVICDCLFSNVSAHGACIRLPTEVALPRKLMIFDGRSRKTYTAEVRWQDDRHAGLYVETGFSD